MQFNSSKSRIVNIGKKSSKEKRWQVGRDRYGKGMFTVWR